MISRRLTLMNADENEKNFICVDLRLSVALTTLSK